MAPKNTHTQQAPSQFSRADMREIAREIAKEEGVLSNKFMRAEIKEVMREVIKEELGEGYDAEREFLHSWMKKTDQFSNGFWGKLGQGFILIFVALIGAFAMSKFGFVPVK